MVTMTAYDALMTEHAQRTARVDSVGWLMQAASESAKAQRRRRSVNATRPAGVAALVAGLLALFVR